MLEQVHGLAPQLALEGRLIKGDVRDKDALFDAVNAHSPDIVIHLAAETGTGQSADEPVRYAAVNVVGTANLIEALKSLKTPPATGSFWQPLALSTAKAPTRALRAASRRRRLAHPTPWPKASSTFSTTAGSRLRH